MSKTNILIVEDESIVAKDIQHSLKKLGYTVVGICSTGEDAITSAQELKPDLVLMDIMLKGDMSGIDAAGQIREKNNIPVITLMINKAQARLNSISVINILANIVKYFTWRTQGSRGR